MAQGPPRCFPFDLVEAALWRDYQERPILELLNTRGELVTIFATRSGSSWTAVVILPPKASVVMACELDQGDFVQMIEWQPEGPET